MAGRQCGIGVCGVWVGRRKSSEIEIQRATAIQVQERRALTGRAAGQRKTRSTRCDCGWGGYIKAFSS